MFVFFETVPPNKEGRKGVRTLYPPYRIRKMASINSTQMFGSLGGLVGNMLPLNSLNK
jgi:hypothetical protein